MFLRRVFGVLLGAFAVIISAYDTKDESPPFTVFVHAPWQCGPGQCKLNLTITRVNEGFRFWMDAEGQEYVAVALAGSAMMGRDNIIECQKSLANPDRSIEVYHSINNGPPLILLRSNERYKDQRIDTIAKNITGGTRDGRIFCSFILNSITKFPESTVDLLKSKYFLQIASGANLNANKTGLAKHDKWATTLRAVSLVKAEGKLRTVDNIVVSPKKGNSAPNLTSGLFLTITLILITRL